MRVDEDLPLELPEKRERDVEVDRDRLAAGEVETSAAAPGRGGTGRRNGQCADLGREPAFFERNETQATASERERIGGSQDGTVVTDDEHLARGFDRGRPGDVRRGCRAEKDNRREQPWRAEAREPSRRERAQKPAAPRPEKR